MSPGEPPERGLWPEPLRNAMAKSHAEYTATGVMSSQVGAPPWDAAWRPHLSPRGLALLCALRGGGPDGEEAAGVLRLARGILAAHLAPGDTLHVPLTPAERNAVVEPGSPRAGAVSVTLPGRTPRDVARLQAFGIDENAPVGAEVNHVARYLPGGGVAAHAGRRRQRNFLDALVCMESRGAGRAMEGCRGSACSPEGWLERELLHKRSRNIANRPEDPPRRPPNLWQVWPCWVVHHCWGRHHRCKIQPCPRDAAAPGRDGRGWGW